MKLKIIFKIIYYLIWLNCTKSNTGEIIEKKKYLKNDKILIKKTKKDV